MTGREYEQAAAQYLRSQGYRGVELTRATGDFGVDLIAWRDGTKCAVQCKYYSAPVGVSAVQEVVAGMAYYGCGAAVVVTNSTFTKAARELAEKNDVLLMEDVQPNASWQSGLLGFGSIVYIILLAALFYGAATETAHARVFLIAGLALAGPGVIAALALLIRRIIRRRR